MWFLGLGISLSLWLFWDTPSGTAAETFRAGAYVVDIAPTGFPVRVNAMFTERTADRVVDPLYAKALALEEGTNRVVMCVVDSCMLPRDLLDAAKSDVTRRTGIATDRLMISSTHTHSAPSAMGCLGSRVDPRYAAFLPARIAAAMVGAVERQTPARVGWAQGDDWDHTFNRRWIRRPDRMLTDPFGDRNVRAHMHPGHQSEDVTGPSGPVDPQLSLLAIQRLSDSKPLAVLANYSMHYYGSDLVSSDYYGRFAKHISAELSADDTFVAILSQGTSGDLMWMDYGSPRREIGYDAYAHEVAQRVAGLFRTLTWHDSAPIRMAERILDFGYRVPDENRLAWAKEKAAQLGEKLPQTQPEIYALEAIYLHDRPRTSLKVQAIRIGELGIATFPNEVFALSGLKVKERSPFASTFNIELANGAEGYIPPPEQHALGGYTTWAARTAGLETNAEPRLVQAALELLQEVAERPVKPESPSDGRYTRTVIASKPEAYWKLNDAILPTAKDVMGKHAGVFEGGVALYLPGIDGRIGFWPPQPVVPNAFSGDQINRAVHFAGGRMKSKISLDPNWSVELWFWNGLPADAREVTGYLFSRGPEGDAQAAGDHLGIGGRFHPESQGRLILFNGNASNQLLWGRTVLALRAWHHVVWSRQGQEVRVYLDGRKEPEISGVLPSTVSKDETSVFVGGRNDGLFSFEGKIDEVSVYSRVLPDTEVAQHYSASGIRPPVDAVPVAARPDSPPLSPLESIRKIHVRPGFGVELVASEPLVQDPVAVDWSPDGRMWVVEMADYPLGMDGKGKPGGRIRVLEDTDGDGRYDRSTVFAEGLSFPNGILTWRDGVIVTAAPQILFLKDQDGDGRADVQEVLVSGLSTGNQQLRANGLRWGLDGWVYCAAGGHHGGYASDTRLKTKSAEVLVGSRDFRFQPDTGALEPESGPSQFGRNRDDWGHWFGTQNSRPLWHYVLPDAYLRRNPFYAPPETTKQIVVPLNPKVWPVSSPEKRYHSFDNAGHFTSACSGMIYRDELLFGPFTSDGYGPMHAFTCEPFHNLVQHNLVLQDGASFSGQRPLGEESSDFFASEDRWCRPVMVRTGPDGALWVVDMYRYMIEHPDWLPENGRAELLPHYRLGEDRGRIYRVFPIDRSARPFLKLAGRNASEWVTALDSPNGWQRDKAHMMLLWKPETSVNAQLASLIRSGANAAGRAHALWVLESWKSLSADLLKTALKDRHPGIRENALRIAEHHPDFDLEADLAALATDPEPKVRLQLAMSLGEWKDSNAGRILAAMLPAASQDPFLFSAVMSSALPHLPSLVAVLANLSESAQSKARGPLLQLAIGLKDRDTLARLLEPWFASQGQSESVAQQSAWAEFLDILSRQGLAPESLKSTSNDLLSKQIDRLDEIFSRAWKTTTNAQAPDTLKSIAGGLVARMPRRNADILPVLLEWLDPRHSPELQQSAMRILGRTAEDSVPKSLFDRWSVMSPEIRKQTLRLMLSREPWTAAWLELEAASGVGSDWDTVQRNQLLKHPSARVRDLAARGLQKSGGSSRSEVIIRFKPALNLNGDPRQGELVFLKRCVVCHAHAGQGHEVGPDLKSVAGHPREKLLTNILDPNADIQPGYHAYQCRLRDGTEWYGLMAAETEHSITLRLADATQREVLRRDIAELKGGTTSLMPEGLEADLTLQEMAHLLAFLNAGMAASPEPRAQSKSQADVRVGASWVSLRSEPSMPLAGYLEDRFTQEQEGDLRVVAVVVEKAGSAPVAMVACDVLWVTREMVDRAASEIFQTTGIPVSHVLVNATHTHHAPGTAPAHAFGWSPKFVDEVRRGIVKAVQDAYFKRTEAGLYFALGEEQTVGANSRLLLRDGNVSWLNPMVEAGDWVRPTGPFDAQLPVLDFRGSDGRSLAMIYNHSTHTIGTRSGLDCRSSGFYGMTAQQLEQELGGVVCFLEGASGSTHNVRGVAVPEAIERLRRAILSARDRAESQSIERVQAIKRPFRFRVRTFNEAEEAAKVHRYTIRYSAPNASRIEEIFAKARNDLRGRQGEERTTWVQVIRLGDLAIVGVPAEYFTGLGLEIKRRSPFPKTFVAELANDWIGYLADREGHRLGGYQTWTGFHSYAEPGTGERVADQAIEMLQELSRSSP